MASIVKRGKKHSVVYYYTDAKGKKQQKWESFESINAARLRKAEVEYQIESDTFEAPSVKTVSELLAEYVRLVGVKKWGVTTYNGKLAKIDNYINPYIGDVELSKVTPRFMDEYYKSMEKKPAACKFGQKDNGFVTKRTILELHHILNPAFRQAVIWGDMTKNPAEHANVDKPPCKKRECWTHEEFLQAAEVCEDLMLLVCMHLSVSTTMRIGEITGLTWDNVHLTEESVQNNSTVIKVDKQLSRVENAAMDALENKGIIQVIRPIFPNPKTSLVLKETKTESSNRKIWVPNYVAELLLQIRELQKADKALYGEHYEDYNLVIAQPCGRPMDKHIVGKAFRKLITENGLHEVEFHSLRHTSVTYKLIWSNGDIKAVQGDSGHAQSSMVTEVYSHILDDGRRRNAEVFNDKFYGGGSQRQEQPKKRGRPKKADQQVSGTVEAELLEMVKRNPDFAKKLLEAIGQ